MKQEYTLAELQTEMDALAQLFDSVTLADPRMGLLDPATLQPLNKVAAVPVLDADGRGMRIVKAKNGLEAVIAQGISVAGTPLCADAGYAAAPPPAGRWRRGRLHPRTEPDAG